MARKTVGEVKDRAQQHLGDDLGDTFNRQSLHYALENAWEDLTNAFMEHQVPAVEVIVTFELAANATVFDPEAEGITNFGSLIFLEERPSGSTQQYTRVRRVEALPQWPSGTRLEVYETHGERFYFVGSLQAIQLRITYYATGGALSTTYDDSAKIAFENVATYLSWRTAAVAGIPKGYAQGQWCEDQAKAALRTILTKRVQDLQDVPHQMPAYRSRSIEYDAILPWLVNINEE